MRHRTMDITGPVLRPVVAGAVLLALAAAIQALINPDFTPIHLKDQSDLILVLKFDVDVKEGKAKASVVKALKGEAPKGPLTFDFLAGAFEAQGTAVCKMIQDGTVDAMLFVGFFEVGDEGGVEMGPQEGARGMLHIGSQWYVLNSVEKDLWDMEKIHSRMLGTWAGSTDMLLRALNYILSDPNADIPVRTNAEWGKHVLVAKVEGTVHDVVPVELAGDGKPHLFAACDKGDRLFRWSDGKLSDVTEKHALTSKSCAALWADLNDDGRLDLLSWDGTTLRHYRQGPDGTLGKPMMNESQTYKDGIIGLGLVRASGKPPVVVLGTRDVPLLLTVSKEGEAGPVTKLAKSDADFGAAGRCLVADFDGDDLPDIMQLFEWGGVFYKGTEAGEFAGPTKVQIGLGKGRSAAAVGDYDADGLLDILTTAEDANRIWHNLGKVHFVETLGLSGEIAYISKSGGVSAVTGDVNNDGRQDILIAYAAMLPHLFFNRGFRSFGHSHQLDLGEQRLLPEAGDGQQAACLGDFDGNGAQDMVLVLRDGEVWYFPRRALDRFALAVTVTLPPGKGLPEPVTVTGWSGKRCLGAWPVTAGGPPAFFGLVDAGPVTLKWRFPGGDEQSKEVLVVDRPVRFTPQPKE